MDCGANTYKIEEYYMVYDDIWESVVPDKKGMLCVGCLEKRLGRKLGERDFKNVPANCHLCSRSSPRLLDRMGWGAS